MNAVQAAFGHVEAIEEGAGIPGIAELRAAQTEPIARPAMVTLATRLSGLLDLSIARDAVWVDVMRQLRDQGRPIYVEIDPQSRRITQFLQPRQQPVGDILEIGKGDMQVNLLLSHAVHVLRGNHPRFSELLQRLRTAQREETMVWVTETPDSHEIVEVK